LRGLPDFSQSRACASGDLQPPPVSLTENLRNGNHATIESFIFMSTLRLPPSHSYPYVTLPKSPHNQIPSFFILQTDKSLEYFINSAGPRRIHSFFITSSGPFLPLDSLSGISLKSLFSQMTP